MSRLHTCEPPSMPSSLLLTLPHLAKESLGLCCPDRLYFLCVLCSSLSLAPVVPWQGGSLHPRLPRAQAEGEIPNTQGWRGRFQTGDRTVKKGPQPGAESPFLWESSSQGECTKLKTWPCQPGVRLCMCRWRGWLHLHRPDPDPSAHCAASLDPAS